MYLNQAEYTVREDHFGTSFILKNPPPTTETAHTQFKLRCKTHGGKVTEMTVLPTDTVGFFKSRYHQLTKIPPGQQVPCVNGERLRDDDKTLGDYGIYHDTQVNMLLNMRGD